jgi:hypothetical protein
MTKSKGLVNQKAPRNGEPLGFSEKVAYAAKASSIKG